MADTVTDNGWAMPLNSRKFHFFRKGMSLCRSMMFLGSDLDPDTNEAKARADDCKQCFKLRLKEREQEKAAAEKTAAEKPGT